MAATGSGHKATRRRWAKRVAAGDVACARCGGLIEPGAPWDLDHADDRAGYLGPSHAFCNRRAGGRASGRRRRALSAMRRADSWSREWL